MDNRKSSIIENFNTVDSNCMILSKNLSKANIFAYRVVKNYSWLKSTSIIIVA